MARRKKQAEIKPARMRSPWWQSGDPERAPILGEMRERMLELRPGIDVDDPRTVLLPAYYDDPQMAALQRRLLAAKGAKA